MNRLVGAVSGFICGFNLLHATESRAMFAVVVLAFLVSVTAFLDLAKEGRR